MGVPKFFRWLSERYPAISQLITENRIPEFDCLYLDMNGIIHNCTHKDTDEPGFRMTEDAMFMAIFNYIEHLFGKIKPKKLFFMAIDGVAPRAKMNQQRSRRFRTALDAERALNKARAEGLEIPSEPPFDSNCITPGTEFMAKLTLQLRYFVNKKVSEDTDWQGVEIVLSGHEAPGEGEHKIMEYIRNAKAQTDYDANLRHCLYGLDADLIMLGLLSHDPHFCLLREEVTFGRQSQQKSKELEHQKFFLLHLCIVREYLGLEFQELLQPGALPFKFDLERVIDDFILMAFFVGNDFLPNLPHLHINEGALALMFNVYKNVLPRAGGYINEEGKINLPRLRLLLDELSHVEYRFFESENADAAWFKGKSMEKEDVMVRTKRKGKLVVSSNQRQLFDQVKAWLQSEQQTKSGKPLNMSPKLRAEDRTFVTDLATSLNLQWQTAEDENGTRNLRLSIPSNAADEQSPEEEEESNFAIDRVLKRYEGAKVVEVTDEESKKSMEEKYQEKYLAWKTKHYTDKFEWGPDNETEMRRLTENYVQGLQWVLYYYYQGVCSWPWFYGYHYSTMISDVKLGLNADLNFTLGQPFHPFEQLMGVLPSRSKKIVPPAYHDLMTNPESPIFDFYPHDFELDMNGKKMEWEAVVKIPFIDEKRLLAAMATKNDQLTEEEKGRNGFGVTLKFTFVPEMDYVYPSSLPGIFPEIAHCKCLENIFDLPTTEGLEMYVGLTNGVKLGAEALAGFPSLKTLPFNGALAFHGVSVFQQDSRNESMVVTLLGTESRSSLQQAKDKLGKSVYVGYPFLQEAMVTSISDELFDYSLSTTASPTPMQVEHSPQEITNWQKKAASIEKFYSKRFGIVIGSVETTVHVQMLKGLRKVEDGSMVKEFADIPGIEPDYALQAVVDSVINEDERFIEKAAAPLHEEFPEGSRAFFLGEYNYGRPLEVVRHVNGKCEIWISIVKGHEAEFGQKIVADGERLRPYVPAFLVAQRLNLHPLVLSKLTSSFSVQSSGLKLNLGLNLKFEAKKQKVLGYSRKGRSGWEYSQKAIDVIQQYMIKFPEFIAGIVRRPSGDTFTDTDFYPGETAKAKMKEIGQWLKSLETKSLERVPLEAEQLDSDVVKQMEEAADANALHGPPIEGKKVGGVPRNALLKPSDAEQRIGNQRFKLGDRVVYILDSGRVPIALRGSVVGITRTTRTLLLDVVFDSSFMSGTSLGGRCSPFRGSTVPGTSVLNLSDRQVMVSSKAAAAQQQRTALDNNTSRAGDGRPHASGQVQSWQAAPPPPSLTMSYRNAAHDGPGARGRAMRGRGGPPRGHYANNSNQGGNHVPPHTNGHVQQRGNHVAQGQDRGRSGAVHRGRVRGDMVSRQKPAEQGGGNDQTGPKNIPSAEQTSADGVVVDATLVENTNGSRGSGNRGQRGRGPRGARRSRA